MARQPRVDHPGATHHLMNRGGRKQPIFLDEGARPFFLELVGEVCRDYGLVLLAYAFMPTHYHLAVRSLWGRLSPAMQRLGAAYTQAVNARQGWDGALFRGRFRNRLVQDDAYLRHLIAYIHANPARAGLPHGDAWTSRQGMFGAEMPPFMDMTPLMELFGGSEDYRAYEAAVIAGEAQGPESFDPDSLWTGSESEVIGGLPLPFRPTAYEAEKQLEALAGSFASRRDPHGRLTTAEVNALRAWWFCRGAAMPQARAGDCMNMSQQAVSRHLRAIHEMAPSRPHLRAAMEELARWFTPEEQERVLIRRRRASERLCPDPIGAPYADFLPVVS